MYCVEEGEYRKESVKRGALAEGRMRGREGTT
jgi:hypothetical protein